jgi:predicted NBD/HSP70 family sugar kinase
LVQRQRLQRGKPFNVSSEHHIVHPRDMRRRCGRRKIITAVGGKDVLRRRPAVSYAYPTHVLEILLASTHAIAARPDPALR